MLLARHVTGLLRNYYVTYHFYPKELLGVVKAGLEQLWQVVVLGRADEPRDGGAC